MKKSWFEDIFLAGLGPESYTVRRKAYMFALITSIMIPLLAIPTVVNFTTSVSTHPLLINAANSIMIAACIASLLILRKGRFGPAVALFAVIMSLRVVFGTLIKLEPWLATGHSNNVYFMFAALVFAAFFTSRRVMVAIGILFVSIIAAVPFIAKGRVDQGMVSLVTGTSINIIIAIVIVTILAYMISLITERSLRAAEEELARNRDLTVELEHQVEQLEATNEEMESMNEELNHTYTELLESNKNLRIFKNFAEASGQGLAMFRPSGTLLYVNRALCILLGREGPGEMAGEDFLACYPGEWKTRLTGEIFPSVTTEGQWIGELPLSARDGTQIPTIQNLFLMSDETGRELCVAAVITDLTERKRMEAHLLHADRVKAIGKLAGGIAHDFNNILTAIMGFGELLLGDLPPGDRRREYAEEILRAGRMSADIVHQLCAFGKGQVMNLAPFDINHEITSLRAILLRYMNEGMELLLDLDPDPPIVFADATQIEQVIINLVINARDSMPVGGRITIRTRHSFMNASGVPGISEEDPRPAAAISFEDTGSGISEELLPRIFEPFFTTKENKEGSGLGLSVVHGIIEQHGGRITVTSIPEGGSTFTAYLPIAKEEPVTPDSAKVEPDRLRGSGERILVVEDREKVRAFASILLREFGYIVFEAENGDRASKVFDDEKGAIDLLFTDIVMPGGSGYDLIDTLTAKKKDLRVLVCSGYAEVESPRRRTFPFLQKPYSVVDLLRAVGEVLGKG